MHAYDGDSSPPRVWLKGASKDVVRGPFAVIEAALAKRLAKGDATGDDLLALRRASHVQSHEQRRMQAEAAHNLSEWTAPTMARPLLAVRRDVPGDCRCAGWDNDDGEIAVRCQGVSGGWQGYRYADWDHVYEDFEGATGATARFAQEITSMGIPKSWDMRARRAQLQRTGAVGEVKKINTRIRKKLDRIEKFAKAEGDGWKANCRYELKEVRDNIKQLADALKGKS